MKAQLFLCFLEAWRGVAIDSRVVALAGRRVLSAAPWKAVFIDDSTAQLGFAACKPLLDVLSFFLVPK